MTSFIFKQNTLNSYTNHHHTTMTSATITEIRDRKNILPTKIAIEFCFTEEKYNSWQAGQAATQYLRVRLALSQSDLVCVISSSAPGCDCDYWLVTGGGHMPIFYHYDPSLDCYHNYTTMQSQSSTSTD